MKYSQKNILQRKKPISSKIFTAKIFLRTVYIWLILMIFIGIIPSDKVKTLTAHLFLTQANTEQYKKVQEKCKKVRLFN